MAPIKLEPGEGIDLHAQGLVLISREFAVNRSAPEKAKRRQKLFFLHVSFRATTYSIYLSIPAHVPRPMTELPGIVARVLCHPSPHPFFQLPGSGSPPLLSPGGWLGSLSCTETHLDGPSISNGHILPRTAQVPEDAEALGSPGETSRCPDKKGRCLDNLLADT